MAIAVMIATAVAILGTPDRNESSLRKFGDVITGLLHLYNNNLICRVNSYGRASIRVEGHVAVSAKTEID